MPSVTLRRGLAAPPEEVWRLVSDPERLAAWWPRVTRVEEATPEAWTTVMSSAKGKAVRADFTRVEADAPRRLVWRQEVAESPFERILAESVTTIELEPAEQGATTVTLTLRHKGRGFARLGFIQLRRAAARQAVGALEGLGELFGAVGRESL